MFKKLAVILIFIFLFTQIQTDFCQAKVINNLDDLIPLFELAKKYMLEKFNMEVTGHVKVGLASAQRLDELYGGEFVGQELGFYRFEDGWHDIYIMKDLGRSRCLGTVAHELTHAWQQENCPYNQGLVLKEGLATWVEVKILQADGSYSRSIDVMRGCRGPYWEGLKLLLEIEDKGGQKAVFDYVTKTVNP